MIGWLAASVFLAIRYPIAPRPRHTAVSLVMAAILGTGLLVRILHPLETQALGQSDAYSHLQFITAIVGNAHLHNPIYPPGHAWTMALPAMVFDIDPYLIARFGGAVPGLLLVLGVYAVTLKLCHSKPAALAASSLVACFPPLTLLAKTSVGVFANQMGLCFIPAILLLFLDWIQSGCTVNRHAATLSLLMAAMIIITPLMLIHLLLIMGIAATILVCRRTLPIKTFLRQMAIVAAPSLVILAIHLTCAYRVNPESIACTKHELAQKAMKYPQQHAASDSAVNHRTPSSAERLLADFFRVKRIGHKNALMDAVSATAILCFAALLIIGCRRPSPPPVLLGTWGIVTGIQAFTGICQFSLFQREGWSLMIAIAVMGGLAFEFARKRMRHTVTAGIGLACAALVSLALTCQNPPRHTFFVSSAESDIVDSIRKTIAFYAGHAHAGTPNPAWLASFRTTDQPIIATRRMAGFSSTQGELTAAIAGHAETLIINTDRPLPPQFNHAKAYLVLLENPSSASAADTTTLPMRHINPIMVSQYTNVRRREVADVQVITSFLQNEAAAIWKITRHNISPALHAFTLEPQRQ
jgi:hypothetical protein